MAEREHFDENGPPGSRLARSYLNVRAEQSGEQQPKGGPSDVRHSVALPRLDRTHLNSPEAQAQYRLAVLARLSASGHAWFTLAQRVRAQRGRDTDN